MVHSSASAAGQESARPTYEPHRMSGLFGHPRGLAGRLVGHLMAVKNQPMNRLAVELLDVWPADVILEIGFGPGQAIKMLARETPASISGIDRSAVMVRQAARRNRAWIAAGRVELRQASAGAIPFAAKRFSKVFAVNSFHHWEDQAAGLAEVRRVLRPGGMVLFCLRMELTRPRFGAAPGLTNDEVAQAKRLLSAAGFSNIEQVDRDLGRRVVCLRGR